MHVEYVRVLCDQFIHGRRHPTLGGSGGRPTVGGSSHTAVLGRETFLPFVG